MSDRSFVSFITFVGGKVSDLTLTAPVNPEALEVPESAVYYSAGGPYCVITGSGPVGARVKDLLQKLGKCYQIIFMFKS